MADPYMLRSGSRVVGYGGVWNSFDPGRVMEFFVADSGRELEVAAFQCLVRASGAIEIEAQTNMPQMLRMLRAFGGEAHEDRILFGEGTATDLPNPGGTFRHAAPSDDRSLFSATPETLAEWVIERDGLIVAEGGVLFHYNPPYGDVFMEVADSERGRGYGSYLVQELRRVCREMGKVPAARCRPENLASRRALERAGMVECGKLIVAKVVQRP